MNDKIARNSARLVELEKSQTAGVVEMREVREDISQLKRTLDKLVWGVVGLALTIAASALGLALAIASHAP